MLLATAEQAVFDLVAEEVATDLALGDDPASPAGGPNTSTRGAATIYGGTVEIQRNIIARSLLGLGDDGDGRCERAALREGLRRATGPSTR